MKRFMYLHFGFEKPTQEMMGAWRTWFASIADRQLDQGGFHGGAVEISADGAEPLTMGMESITGYNIIEAESLKEAEALAQGNPFVASLRIYEIK